jgi:two-component system, OmpR family, aerobic respiration control sensor histidine kinase ArcB
MSLNDDIKKLQLEILKKDNEISRITTLLNNSQNKLLEKEAYFSDILANVPGFVYWLDQNNVYQGCNDSLAKNVGLKSKKDIIGKTNSQMPWKEQAGQINDFNNLVMQSRKPYKKEEIVQFGEVTRSFISEKVPLFNSKKEVIGLVGVSVDITDQKIIEQELLQANEKINKSAIAMAKAEAATLISKTKADSEEEMRKTVMMLVGDIVHDLRTPIATIRTVADILDELMPVLLEIIEEAKSLGTPKANLINKKKWNYLNDKVPITSIKSAVILMDDFINTTLHELAYAQKEHAPGLIKENLVKCSSRRIIENTLEAYPFTEKIKINQNVSYDFFLMGNSILIMKILFNLIKNALDQISLKGNGEITITTESTTDENLLKIKDNAGGASPDVVSKLFNGYFTTKKNGTGIGLAYCKQIMENFGGSILCNSVYGESMEFILKFPKIAD